MIIFPYIVFSQYQPAGNNIINHNGYSLDYNFIHKQANWVYYTLTSSDLEKVAKRKNKFKENPKINLNQATLKDYKKSGYDRGHLCPSADRISNQEYNNQTFYLSNMSPQKPQFNRDIWKNIEIEVRKNTWQSDTLFIVTGGILTENLPIIGSGVSVPEWFYKIIFVKDKAKMIAYLIRNDRSKANTSSFIITVDKIEQITGIDFFHQLPDELENKLESQIYYW